MKSLIKRISIAGAIAGSLSVACLAQFLGGEVPVVDWGAIFKLTAEAEQLAREYSLLTQTYETTVSTYNQIQNSARMITGKDGWRYFAAPVMYPASSDTYGTSGGWMSTLNNGLASVRNYEVATARATNPYSMVSRLSSAGQNQFAHNYATVELNDGTAQHAMAVTGNVRALQAFQAQVLAKLQADSLSDAPELNTEVGIMNKVNAATLIHAQSVQDTNKLLAAMADQQTIEAKVRHDALIGAINTAVVEQAAQQTNFHTIWDGDTAAHNARIP